MFRDDALSQEVAAWWLTHRGDLLLTVHGVYAVNFKLDGRPSPPTVGTRAVQEAANYNMGRLDGRQTCSCGIGRQHRLDEHTHDTIVLFTLEGDVTNGPVLAEAMRDMLTTYAGRLDGFNFIESKDYRII